MSRQIKAIAAGVAGFLAPVGGLVIANEGHMTGADWMVAAATAVVVYAATYAAPKNAA